MATAPLQTTLQAPLLPICPAASGVWWSLRCFSSRCAKCQRPLALSFQASSAGSFKHGNPAGLQEPKLWRQVTKHRSTLNLEMQQIRCLVLKCLQTPTGFDNSCDPNVVGNNHCPECKAKRPKQNTSILFLNLKGVSEFS